MNFADSSTVETPELVLLRDLPVNTDDVPDNVGVATSIADKDGIWFPKLSEIGSTAATHDDLKKMSETLEFKQYVKDIDFETFKALEQENIEQEHIERENIEREILSFKELLTRLTTTRIESRLTT